jgi:hypothetical protein
MKILYFFLLLWVIFALLDPDPDPATEINADPCGSGSETLKAIPYVFMIIFVYSTGIQHIRYCADGC